jgi:hypothetical protein
MTNLFTTIEDRELVTATGGAHSFIEPLVRQTFKGPELEQVLKLPFGQQVRVLNARLRSE